VRARLIGVVCLAVAALVVSAVTPASVLGAGATFPVEIVYKGSYEYHEKAEEGGTVISYINQDLTWDWSASGSVPISGGSSTKMYGVKELRGHLTVSGIGSETGGYATGQTCKYRAGDYLASTPIQVKLQVDPGGLQAGYGLGIPGAVARCNGGPGRHPEDVLYCDLTLCEGGICPATPPAIDSAAKFKPPVETAFEPTTDYTKTGYVPIDKKLSSSEVNYDLPADLGSVSTTCHVLKGYVDETERISISSTVYVFIKKS
jgi:hypothetical protein